MAFKMKLVAGLGNPGIQYEMTRHNVGFQVVDSLCTATGATLRYESKYKGYFCKTKFKNQDILLLKPDTYMNLSGEAVRAIANYLKVETTDILVVHDDVSLILGRVKLQQAGGAGGQHGVESIIECLGKNTFDRLKVGVGPDPGGARRASFVLSKPAPEDAELYQKSLELASETAQSWIVNGPLDTANKYNGINLAQPVEVKPKVRPPNEQEIEALGLFEEALRAVSEKLKEKGVVLAEGDIIRSTLKRQVMGGLDAEEIKRLHEEFYREIPQLHRVHEQRWKKLIEQRWLSEGDKQGS